MRGFTSPLWPIRYNPFPDELLSCWLVRLAHGHGLKVQTFCNLMFGNRRQVWNRDIDRLAPTWLVEELILRTGTSPEVAWGTTLRAYEGILYPKFRLSSTLKWILALKVYHRTRQGYGLQFCPICLTEDEIPYFRKHWRIALNTVCSKHGTMLFDRCPHCGAAVAFHRLDMAGAEAIDVAPLREIISELESLENFKIQLLTNNDQDGWTILIGVSVSEDGEIDLRLFIWTGENQLRERRMAAFSVEHDAECIKIVAIESDPVHMKLYIRSNDNETDLLEILNCATSDFISRPEPKTEDVSKIISWVFDIS